MCLKIVLHIKIQFVSSDLMVVNKTHFKRHIWTLQAFLCHPVVILDYCRDEGKLCDHLTKHLTWSQLQL